MSDVERTRRIGENEALFRRVNNAVEEINDAREVDLDELEIICECGDPGCVERIPVRLLNTRRSGRSRRTLRSGLAT